MPTYNRAQFIVSAIESVLSQTFKDWELLIVDDGSTDNTRNVVLPYLQDLRIKYYFQTNQERSITRNNGIAKSNGDFICFLDSDDYYLNDHLNVLYDFINSNNITTGCLYTQSYSQNELRNKTLNCVYSKIRNNGIYNILFESLININSICLSNDCFKQNKFPENFILFEDNHLWIRILSLYKFYYINKPTTVTVEHSRRTVNITTKDIYRKDKMYFEAVNDLIENYNWVKVSSDEWKNFKALKKLTLAFEALKNHNLIAIYKFTFESIREKFLPNKVSKYCKLLFLGWLFTLLKIKI